MRLVAIDTSTMTTSVAALDDEVVRVARDAPASPHSESLLPLVDEVLGAAGWAPADVEAFACGVGPGSFTGIRIGLATAKGLAFALERPLLAISSLAALACEAGPGLVLPVVDARRGDVYGALYRVAEGAIPERLLDEVVIPPTVLVERARTLAGNMPILVVGDGRGVAPELFAQLAAPPTETRVTPSAAWIGKLAARRFAAGATDELAHATPAYIRPVAAEEKLGAPR